VTRLIIWRHGQTEWNSNNRVQGHTDVALDEVGVAQAAAAAVTLAALHPDVLVASDLRRAADTARALATETGLPIHFDPRLREQYFGAWQGMSGDELAAAYPGDYARWQRGEAIDGFDIEDRDDLAKRVGAGIRDAISRADGGTVVVATHGGAAKTALGEMLGWHRDILRQIAGLANCHWSELRLHPLRGWVLRAHNVGGTSRPTT
jgi:broad specificity phosphatase PhoE